MQDSVFTKIIKRELPAEILYEDDRLIVILSINPHFDGHTLVIPKVQIDQFQDLNEEDFLNIMSLSRKMARVLKKVFGSKRIGLVAEGFAVPHAHIHLVPMNKIGDLDHTKAKSATPSQLKEVAGKIRDYINKNGFE